MWSEMWKKLNLFKSGENEILKMLGKHITISLHAMDSLIRMVSSEEDIIKFKNDIERYEKEGDKLAYKSSRLVIEGAISILAINNLLKVIDDTDMLLDKILYLARETYRIKELLNFKDKKIWIPVYENILHSNLIIRELSGLIDDAKENGMQPLLKKRDRIEELEEEGDEMKDRALNILYHMTGEIDDKTFILLRNYILTIDDLEDLCEDIANHLVLLKHIFEI